MSANSQRSVIEFIVPHLIERDMPVNRSTIGAFLTKNKIYSPQDFEAAYKHPDGMVVNFVRQYAVSKNNNR